MFTGLSALIVEEELLIALEIQHVLEEAGISRVDIALNSEQARAMRLDFAEYGLAVVEAHMGAVQVVEFCRELQGLGVPLVISSADHAVAHLFPGAGLLHKPFDARDLLDACLVARGTAQA